MADGNGETIHVEAFGAKLAARGVVITILLGQALAGAALWYHADAQFASLRSSALALANARIEATRDVIDMIKTDHRRLTETVEHMECLLYLSQADRKEYFRRRQEEPLTATMWCP